MGKTIEFTLHGTEYTVSDFISEYEYTNTLAALVGKTMPGGGLKGCSEAATCFRCAFFATKYEDICKEIWRGQACNIKEIIE